MQGIKNLKEISREKAVELLWREGVLDFKLSEPQKIIKKGIVEDATKISVVMCARRLGKTYLMLTMAFEVCLKTPGAIVKYVFPKQKAAKRNIFPEIRKIAMDCPKDLMPELKVADLLVQFPNGSQIQLAGCDSGNIENIRGGNSHLNIVDEAGFADDLKYAVRSVLAPTTKLTKGRTILVSTPSRSENHEFIQDFVLPYMAEDRIKVFSIFDNPQFTEAIIKDALDDYPEGEKDPEFRREYMCEIIRNAEKAILPSFNTEAELEIVTDQYVRPVYYDPYVSFDIGGVDLSAILFAYYDYENACLVVEDELIADGTTNTEILAALIQEKEKQLWENPLDKSQIPPYLRVIDTNNKILATDLQKLHGLTFTPVKKDQKQAAINSLDVAISRRQIKIHPRCKHLIYHMKMAEWNKSQSDFKRLKDSPSGKIRGGHADALAAMVYLHRSIVKSHNPFPSGYGVPTSSNYFKSLKQSENAQSELGNMLKNMFKKR